MNRNMKKWGFAGWAVCALLIAYVFSAIGVEATIGRNSQYTQQNYFSLSGPVTFRGTVASDEQCNVSPVCYGQCFCEVNLTQVLDDPQNLLMGVSSLEVCYGNTPMNFRKGCQVEVCGFYWKHGGPLQCVGKVTTGRTGYIIPTIPWKYVVTEHRKTQTGSMFTGDYLVFPFPPCLTSKKETGIPTSYYSQLIDMEDFDNDGDFDYLVMKVCPGATGPEAWFLLYTNIDGLIFTRTVIDDSIPLSDDLWEAGNIGLTAADFDGDGLPDFAATVPQSGAYANEIRFYENTGHSPATFTYRAKDTIVASWAVHARDMDAGDFDQKGDYDFVIFDYPHGGDGHFAIYWYENKGDWIFAAHPVVDKVGNPITTPHSVAMIVAGDFGSPLDSPNQGSADGWLDFIVGQDDDGDPGQAWIYFNRPGGADGDFDGPHKAYDLEPDIVSGSDQPGWGCADALDCDGDQILDIIATGGKDDPLKHALYFVKGKGNGEFDDPVKYDGDLDGAGPAVAAPPVWFYAKLPPEEKIIAPGIFSTFHLHHDVVELCMRANKEDYSNVIYGIEIFPDDQQPCWESVEAIEAPDGWSFEKIDNGVRFYTETDPLLICQSAKFIFKVRAERISWWIRIRVIDQSHESLGMKVSTRWWLYHYCMM